MDAAVYDGYGINIGLQVAFDPEDKENNNRQKPDAIEYNEDDGHKEEEVPEMPTVLHKKYYPSAEELYGHGEEIIVQVKDIQALTEPIIAVKGKKFAYAKPYLRNAKDDLECAQILISLQSHSVLPLRSHNGKKLFICLVCKKEYSKKHDLQMHKRMHTEEKSSGHNKSYNVGNLRGIVSSKYISCNVFNQTFPRGTQHAHSAVVEFLCTICNKAFPTDYDLIRHGDTHNLEKMLGSLNLQG